LKLDTSKKTFLDLTEKERQTMEYDVEIILGLPLHHECLIAETVRGFLGELLWQVWEKGESFNGKRPWGDSGWEHDLHYPIVRAGLVTGSFNMHGDLLEYDVKGADKIISRCILHIKNG
jgi:hypothetical protein